MTWLQALREHWREHPPVHKIVAAFAGYKPAAPALTAVKTTAPITLKITPMDGQMSQQMAADGRIIP